LKRSSSQTRLPVGSDTLLWAFAEDPKANRKDSEMGSLLPDTRKDRSDGSAGAETLAVKQMRLAHRKSKHAFLPSRASGLLTSNDPANYYIYLVWRSNTYGIITSSTHTFRSCSIAASSYPGACRRNAQIVKYFVGNHSDGIKRGARFPEPAKLAEPAKPPPAVGRSVREKRRRFQAARSASAA
jgi:hypothetical protein